MSDITLDYTNTTDFIKEDEIENKIVSYVSSRRKLLEKTGEGADFLGWVDLAGKTTEKEIEDIKEVAQKIRDECDVFISIGIGGSYLGARAAIECLLPNFYNHNTKPEIYFAGHSLSSRYMKDLLSLCKEKKVAVNVISKSGTTTEPAIAFRLIRDWMVSIYGKETAHRHIIATTDRAKGALKKLADEEGIRTFVIPDDVGGRFSVLTPVGLIPIAVAGIDITEMLRGASDGEKEFRDEPELRANPSSMYAVLRHILYEKGKRIEILANFEPQLHYIAEWWKQLFGESEGKDGKGIFPASCDFTTDLHSMGQWIQEGYRNIFETFLNVEDCGAEIILGKEEKDLDKLNYLEGKSLEFVNQQAFLGTRAAHRDGGVPNMTINIPRISPYIIGKLFYFFEWAVGISGYMLGVNPFNQEGVESYKKNMFALLGRPGFEEETKKIQQRLSCEEKKIVGRVKATS